VRVVIGIIRGNLFLQTGGPLPKVDRAKKVRKRDLGSGRFRRVLLEVFKIWGESWEGG